MRELPLEDVLRQRLSLVRRMGERNCGSCSRAYVEAKQAQNVLDYDDLLLYWAQMHERSGARRRYRRPVRSCAGRRISGHQPPAGLDPAGAEARTAAASPSSATTRNRSIRSAPPRCATFSIFRAQFSPPADIITLDRNYRSTQPILAAANGVIDLAAERFTKNLWTERQSAERPQLVSVRDEADQARYIVERVLENREVGTCPEAAGRAVPRPRTTAARSRSS